MVLSNKLSNCASGAPSFNWARMIAEITIEAGISQNNRARPNLTVEKVSARARAELGRAMENFTQRSKQEFRRCFRDQSHMLRSNTILFY